MSGRVSRRVSRREFLASAAAAALAASRGTFAARRRAARPNVLFILADDLGWGDLSCYGRPDYRTPNLDRLAAEGTRLTHAYSASPVCTPTRVALATGRYPQRTAIGLEEPLVERGMLRRQGRDPGLPPEHPTVASLLKSAGYRTALVGKWHMGYLPKYGPVKSGYEEFFGITSGAADYFTHKDPGGTPDLYEAEVPVERAGYMTDLITERAVQFLARRHERPFYLSLHYTAPHWPWEGPRDEAVSRTLGQGRAGMIKGGSLKTYAEMMRRLDEGVGRVLRALSGANLERQTLVVFTSDNGGERFSFNWPFRGEKYQLLEGGIRVPAIARWPGKIPAGRTTDQIAITMDWTATMIALAGARPDPAYPLDGVDLLPALRGAAPASERTLFWRHHKSAAVRRGRWKYLQDEEGEHLFDHGGDEREQADFRQSHAAVFEQLKSAYADWNRQLLPRPAQA